MLFRRRRQARQRIAFVAALAFTYLASVAPAAATVIYCIGEGHSGFERVAGSERGCASCCHEELEGSAHDGREAEECTDIALSSEQAVRSGASADRHDDAAAPLIELPSRLFDEASRPAAFVAARGASPPGAGAPALRRSVVLLI